MAILLREEGLLDRTIIYATDINPRSLDKAKQGIFSMENVRAYTANYQQAGGQRSFADYYTAAYGYAIFDKTPVRERDLRRSQPGDRQRVLRNSINFVP